MSVLEVDVVIVAYRSAAHLRGCVEPLCRDSALHPVVVDNACPEASVETVADIPVRVIRMGHNVGFGAGCNAGASVGSAPVILFLNPDARADPQGVHRLASWFAADPSVGAVGPCIVGPDGAAHFAARRLPRLRSAFGEAFFLHHFLRRSQWVTEFVRTPQMGIQPEWLSGAALCVRRTSFEALGGFDERFFMYSEDTDLGARLLATRSRLVHDPAVTVVHVGGASAPGPGQVSMRLRARLLYTEIHEAGVRRMAFRLAYVLHELLRVPLAAGRSGSELRARLASLQVALRTSRRLSA